MVFLHPVFTILFIFLILYSLVEVNREGGKTPVFIVWGLAVYMIIIIGYRNFVGADYPVYKTLFDLYFPTVDYGQIVDKMLFRKSDLEIEPLYILLNKIVYMFGLFKFKEFTLVCATITIGSKLAVFYKNSALPALSVLLFLLPGFFIADSGHMRQALGMTMCLVSLKFIKERKIWWYLLCLYTAYNFHKSAFIFFPAYWLATIPMNSARIFYLIIICVILSPFKLYNSFSPFLNTLNLQDVSNGYNGYINYEDKASTFMDALMIMLSIMLIAYNKIACQKIYYYEYMRNILLMGLCLYFIMRSNPIFSTRLPGSYLGFMPLVIPNIIAAVDQGTKRRLHLLFVTYTIFYYFVFAKYQAVPGRFTPDRYKNYLWSS